MSHDNDNALMLGSSPIAVDMPADEFCRQGKLLIEWVAKYLDDPRQYPVLPQCQPGDLKQQLPAFAPVDGESMDFIWKDFVRLILPAVTHWNHPNFHAYFSISSSAPGILGELLTAALDSNAMLWKSCPAATELEQITLSWVLDWLQLPTSWFGMILDSASLGALQAIVAARQKVNAKSRTHGTSGRLVAYVSEQTHSSIEKAAIAAGIGQCNVRHIPVDSAYRMIPEALEQAIRSDLNGNLIPFFAVATVGTTSCTAVDQVSAIGSICRLYNVWLHVDAAYGGAFGLLPECRQFFNGVERADSFVLNPHKTMMVPLDCSLFYTVHPSILKNAFSLKAEYLTTDIDALDFMDYGLALGRRFRALKLWFTMRYFGRNGMAASLRKILQLASWLSERIGEDPRFEVMSATNMGLVCFRCAAGDDSTRELMRRINASGRFFVSHAVLRNHFTIRVAIGNIRTEFRDLEALWNEIASCIESQF